MTLALLAVLSQLWFGGLDGAFVLVDGRTGETWRLDAAACGQRHAPHSTFKIPHAAIALETKVVTTDEVIEWDPRRFPRKDFWPEVWTDRTHDLRSAVKHSVVPYFQALAERLGPRAEREWLQRIDYGNADPSSGLTDFWLGGSLQISPDEQVAFLQRFHEGKLFSPETTRQVKDMIVLEETPEYRLSGKTGAGPEGDGFRGWLVGYVERGERVWFYALTVKGPDFASIRDLRLHATKQILKERGILP